MHFLFMILNYKNRYHRLNKVLKIKNFENPLPGVLVIKKIKLYRKLQSSVFNFLKQNLKIAFPDKSFEDTKTF